jgi:small subunit ribosomal protein S1
MEALRSYETLARAAEAGDILEARVIRCDYKHDLTVDLGCMKGHIPRNEGAMGIAEGRVRDIALASRVNKPVCFTVTGFETDEFGELAAVCSRRAVQERAWADYVSQLQSGEVIDARITHLAPFGAFCDIGCGLVSLIPIERISISRIGRPSDRFWEGEDIFALVLSVEQSGRVYLSHRELLGTWEENIAHFHTGDTVAGIIREVMDYGAFVELTPNLVGLAEPHEKARSGLHASVLIKNINSPNKKVRMFILDAFEADYPPAPLRYYVSGGKLDKFVY